MPKIEKNKINQKIRIVKMTKEDLAAIFKLGKAHWKNETWLTMSYLQSSFDQAGLDYVAKSENKIIGCVLFVYEDIVKNWIRYLIVEKTFRRCGIGRALLQKIFEKIKSGESIFVDMSVTDKNTIIFYNKLGFKNCGKIKNLYGNESAYIFKKIIK